MKGGTRIYDASRLGQPIPKPRHQCQHVGAGYLTAARVRTKEAVIDMCFECYRKGYHSMKLTSEGKVGQ